jgi:NAD(P)-dependent dehydrogenase (short-subunit alcohol dehydrogenase family)
VSGLVDGKVVLVTGGASGIGRASARVFAREGARVVVSDLDEAQGQATVAELRERGAEASFFPADVSVEPAVEALVAHVLDSFGRLDCAHNNAGILGGGGPLHEIDLESWQRTLTTNLTGVFLCMKHEIRAMLACGEGAIVNTSSGAGIVGTPGLAPYCASKHGILGLTKTAAMENARNGIRVNAVCPGSTDTPMLRAAMGRDPTLEKLILSSQPSGRLAEAREVAESVVWLCSDRASFVSGESMLVDGAAVAR